MTAMKDRPGCSPTVAKIIAARGGDIDPVSFLNPRLKELPDLAGFTNLDHGGELLARAIEEEHAIAIFGDYDADGVTACALMVDFIEACGATAEHYLPNRLKEGYGLNLKAIDAMAAAFTARGRTRGEMLLLTVDCGISSTAEIAHARELGFVVLVTDHHQTETPPPADCVINPQLPGSPDFLGLSGVGVAFFLAASARKILRQGGYWRNGAGEPDIREFLDLVALGTVADMVPLLGVNRILVRAGIERINNNPRPGIRSIIATSGLVNGHIGGRDISFRLAPRLNAAGRMGRTETAFDLLREKKTAPANEIATRLEKLNLKRREITDRTITLLDKNSNKQEDKKETFMVFKGNDLHLGVIGLAAAKLMRKWQRPTIVFSGNNGVAIGSARAPDGYDLYRILAQCAGLFIAFGGHRQACGVTIKEENIPLFEARLRELDIYCDESLMEPDPDLDINAAELFSEKFLIDFVNLEPFGQGNPEPILRTSEAIIPEGLAPVGTDSLKFTLVTGEGEMPAISFGSADRLDILNTRKHHILFQLSRNHFHGRVSWQAVVQGFRAELS